MDDQVVEIEFVEPPEWMSAREYLNLKAILFFCDATKQGTFQWRRNWPEHRRLVRAGYITWADHPSMSKGFAMVHITDQGRELIEKTS